MIVETAAEKLRRMKSDKRLGEGLGKL